MKLKIFLPLCIVLFGCVQKKSTLSENNKSVKVNRTVEDSLTELKYWHYKNLKEVINDTNLLHRWMKNDYYPNLNFVSKSGYAYLEIDGNCSLEFKVQIKDSKSGYLIFSQFFCSTLSDKFKGDSYAQVLKKGDAFSQLTLINDSTLNISYFNYELKSLINGLFPEYENVLIDEYYAMR